MLSSAFLAAFAAANYILSLCICSRLFLSSAYWRSSASGSVSKAPFHSWFNSTSLSKAAFTSMNMSSTVLWSNFSSSAALKVESGWYFWASRRYESLMRLILIDYSASFKGISRVCKHLTTSTCIVVGILLKADDVVYSSWDCCYVPKHLPWPPYTDSILLFIKLIQVPFISSYLRVCIAAGA